MADKMRTQKNIIKLSSQYYLELDPELTEENKNTDVFLGWEYSQGKIKAKTLQKLFPKSNIQFFPVAKTNLQESCILKNIELLKDKFKHVTNAHILIDWPEECQSLLQNLQSSFPHSVTLTSKNHLANKDNSSTVDNLILNIEDDPILFLESTEPRRYLLNIFKNNIIKTHCIGSIESYLQYQLFVSNTEKISLKSECIVNGSLTAWMQYQLAQTFPSEIFRHEFMQNKAEQIFKNVMHYIFSHLNENIIIICGYKTMNLIELHLEKIKSRNDLKIYEKNNLAYLKEKKEKINQHFMLSQPSKDSFLEYIHVPGFFISDLLEEKTPLVNWLDFARKSYANSFIRASKNYNDWTKLDINAAQERDYFRFSYRLAQDRNMFFPSIFDILVAGSAVVDSNFSYELMKECKKFPENEKLASSLPEIHLPLDHFFKHTEKVSIEKFSTIQSKKKFKKTKLKAVEKISQQKNITPISEEKYADNTWVHEDHPYSCSFPSEDIFMEKLALDIKKNMSDKLKSQEINYQELQTDFYEGLDIRETIRNWHKEKIIVKELHNTGKPDIGTVVFSFADPAKDSYYSWRSFWLAEQHDDSNLMFYATPFKDNLIGPGIAKSEFGGFAVIPLPSSIENPWGNPFIQHYARNATECLILAGALSTNHKSILFISNHPPSQHIAKILKQSRKNIIYAKLDEFPQEDIRLVRTFHILAEAGVRNYAQKYIRKDS